MVNNLYLHAQNWKTKLRNKIMNKKCFFLLLLFSLFDSLSAKDTIYVQKLNMADPVALRMPVQMDSTNLKGEKFELKDLLATNVRLPIQKDFTNMLDTFGDEIEIPKAKSDYQVRFLSFELMGDRYCKGNLLITTPNMIELYVDGKKEGVKNTTEKDAKKAKKLSKEITFLPYQKQQVTIKYLATAKDEDNTPIKIAVYASSDSLAEFSITNNGLRRTKIQDGLDGVRVASSRISPDGQYMLIKYRMVDKTGKVSSYTELRNLKTGNNTIVNEGIKEWMPKSNKLYYVKQFVGALQLIAVNADNLTESVIADNIPKGDFVFSPDETFLIYTDKEENDDRKGDFKLLISPEDRQPDYLDRQYLYQYTLATGVKQRLTFGKQSTNLNDISADSHYILYSCSKETVTEHPFSQSSMYILDLHTMKVDTLWTDEKFVNTALFSPDAKSVIITGAPEAFGGIGLEVMEGQTANFFDTQAYIMNVATKEVKAITKKFDPAIKQTAWNAHDDLIYLLTVDKDRENIYSYNPKNDEFRKLDLPEDVISSFSLAQSANIAAFTGRSIANPARAYSYDLKGGKSTLLSDPMQPVMETLELGQVKDWSFTSSDGTVIEGFYHLPPDFDSSKKYPMIVYYYGGTTPTARTFEHPYSMHNFAALGYVVYTIQPSGAIGYGQEFSARHVNAWGKRTAEDIIEGTKEFVRQHGFVDESKIGCVGASYGGFMTMYLQTQTDMFAAAVAHAGISALSSYWGEGYWGYTYSAGASAHSYPWNNRELYVNQSPLFGADKIKTPILLTHGMADTNVPVGESIQMFTALKVLGAPVEFLQIKDENHGIMNHDRRIQWSYSMYAWFNKWLKDQPEWWNTLYPDKMK